MILILVKTIIIKILLTYIY